jgi:2-dehydro-3-deoxygalactonokinase
MTAAFIGIDWGTTHRRATLIAADGTLVAERADGEGALACKGRFAASLEALIAGWPEADASLPVVMAGMVGAAIGWQAVPYLDGGTPLSALARHLTPVAETPPGRRWFIAPGYRLHGDGGEVDVMRGEETQLFGALHLLGPNAADGCYVLPGTHSKWVRLHGGRITELRTYMTGELFALLRRHSLLGRLMPEDAADDRDDDAAFTQGLDRAAAPGGLLHHLFSARTAGLFGRIEGPALAAYLSGLVIGDEIGSALATVPRDVPLLLVGAPALCARYERALAHRGVSAELLPETVGARGSHAIARAAGLIDG